MARSQQIQQTEFLRGRIKKIIKDEFLGWHYLIVFIDFGQQQWVHIEDIRLIPEQLRKIDELAYKCMLEGIYPRHYTGDGGSEEAKNVFRNLCKNQGSECRFQSEMMPDLYRTNCVTLYAEVCLGSLF